MVNQPYSGSADQTSLELQALRGAIDDLRRRPVSVDAEQLRSVVIASLREASAPPPNLLVTAIRRLDRIEARLEAMELALTGGAAIPIAQTPAQGVASAVAQPMVMPAPDPEAVADALARRLASTYEPKSIAPPPGPPTPAVVAEVVASVRPLVADAARGVLERTGREASQEALQLLEETTNAVLDRAAGVVGPVVEHVSPFAPPVEAAVAPAAAPSAGGIDPLLVADAIATRVTESINRAGASLDPAVLASAVATEVVRRTAGGAPAAASIPVASMPIATLLEAVARVEGEVSRVTAAPDAVIGALGRLEAGITALASALEADRQEQLRALQEGLEEMKTGGVAAVEEVSEPRGEAPFDQLRDDLAAQREALGEAVGEIKQLIESPELLDQMTTRLTQMELGITALLEHAVAPPPVEADPTVPDTALTDAVSHQASQIAELITGVASMREIVEEITTDAASQQATQIRDLTADVASMREVLDHLTSLREDVLLTKEDLTTTMPEVVDTTVAKAMQPLVDIVGSRRDVDAGALAGIAERLSAIQDATISDRPALEHLMELSGPLVAISGRLAELEASFQSLSRRDGPAGELFERMAVIERAIVEFASSGGADNIEERLREAIEDLLEGRESLAKVSDVDSSLAVVMARLDDIAADTALARTIEPALAAIGESVGALSVLGARMNSVEVAVHSAAKTNATELATRADEVAARLDDLASAVTEKVEHIDTGMGSVRDGVDEMRARMEQAGDGLNHMEERVERLGAAVDQIPDRLDQIRENVDRLREGAHQSSTDLAHLREVVEPLLELPTHISDAHAELKAGLPGAIGAPLAEALRPVLEAIESQRADDALAGIAERLAGFAQHLRSIEAAALADGVAIEELSGAGGPLAAISKRLTEMEATLHTVPRKDGPAGELFERLAAIEGAVVALSSPGATEALAERMQEAIAEFAASREGLAKVTDVDGALALVSARLDLIAGDAAAVRGMQPTLDSVEEAVSALSALGARISAVEVAVHAAAKNTATEAAARSDEITGRLDDISNAFSQQVDKIEAAIAADSHAVDFGPIVDSIHAAVGPLGAQVSEIDETLRSQPDVMAAVAELRESVTDLERRMPPAYDSRFEDLGRSIGDVSGAVDALASSVSSVRARVDAGAGVADIGRRAADAAEAAVASLASLRSDLIDNSAGTARTTDQAAARLAALVEESVTLLTERIDRLAGMVERR